MSGVAFIFVGPSVLVCLPNSLFLMGVGQALVGIFTATMLIPGLPEMIESIKPKFPRSQERQVNDYSSGIFNSFLGIGQMLAPMYGSTVTEAVGFRKTADIVAIICFVFGIIYFLCGDGVEAFKTTCHNIKNKGQMNEMHVEKSDTSSTKFTKLSDASTLKVPKLHSTSVIKILIN